MTLTRSFTMGSMARVAKSIVEIPLGEVTINFLPSGE
jgi:hypothetical protein